MVKLLLNAATVLAVAVCFFITDLTAANTPKSSWTDSLDAYLFKDNEKPKRGGLRTDAAVVVRDGQVVYEKYARGYDANKRHVMWSVSKTVMSLLYGVALKEKRITLDDSICKYEKFENDKFCAIQLRHVLSWSTGIKWLEEYETSGRPKEASVLAMLFGEGRTDFFSFVKTQPIEFSPGEAWRYSSGDSILASRLLRKIFDSADLPAVYKEKIFDPIGMQNWFWESDAAGTLAGAYYFYSSARDLAKIGELILNGGKWDKKQIVAKDFIDFMKTMPPAYKTKRLDYKTGFVSGRHIWINEPADSGAETPWPDAPADTLMAVGHWQQVLVIIPSLKTVGVRLGDTRDGSFKVPGFVAQIASVGRQKWP